MTGLRFHGIALLVAGAGLLAAPTLASESGGIEVSRGPDGVLTFTSRPTTDSAPAQSRTGARRAPAEIERLIRVTADRYGIDSRLVRAVAQVESAFDTAALSAKGAVGVMQLMPGTAKDLGVRDPWDARQNIDGGVRYLRQMLERFGGRLQLALAAYNAGPSTVERYDGIPPYRETIGYVRKVLAIYRGDVPELQIGSRVASAASNGGADSSPRYRPIRMHRDASGQLVLTTQ